eukprot:CAMPEP_0179016778 /NCGR_PEP_ID=MMETSP0796-20121207/3497_1 /TAXON_ID=73915 /ORGANISM="Pyrodinium bahamense, Strain pbaha01" /LENGTH=50 /DNA_ID=CAMNT_0020712483 /DNA_START=41 /DNA_END=193 /DNA_ORIENTATION=+
MPLFRRRGAWRISVKRDSDYSLHRRRFDAGRIIHNVLARDQDSRPAQRSD